MRWSESGVATEEPNSASARALAFLRDGFVCVDRFVDSVELPAMQREVDTVLAQPLPPGCERPHNTLAPLRWNHAIVQRLLRSERRRRALADAVGAADLRWISGYVSVKSPGSAALWWHQDWWCWDHPATYKHPAAQVAVLCYLAKTTRSNGALRVLPGTHHRSIRLHAALPEAHADESGDLDTEHPAMRDHDGQVTLDVDAGDAVVSDYRLLHGTHPNATAERRDCILLTFAPAWRELPADIRAHLIRHPALPTEEERARADPADVELMASFDGEPHDLALNRVAPDEFAVAS